MLSDWLARVLAADLAIDLGTANTRVFAQGEGIVLDEPSIIAVRQEDHSVLAVGRGAKAMLGRTPPSIVATRPVRDGVIADFDVAAQMLQHFIATARRPRGRFLRPRVVVAIPAGITGVERRAVRDAALKASAREVFLIEAPIAAAIGAGLPVAEPGGHLIADIGGGTTEVAVIAFAGVVDCESVRIAGDEMDEAIIQYIRKHYNLLVGERQAEEVKCSLGSAVPPTGEPRGVDVTGRDLVDGLPKSVLVTGKEIYDALRDLVAAIVETVRACLDRTPPELAADIVDTGVVLTGGGAQLPGLVQLVREETGLPTTRADQPLLCVARGVGGLLDELDLLERVATRA